nr:hypothetical protein [Tanacetum cinerariifolium]
MGLKKKTVVVTSDPLALIAKKTKVSKRKEKVIVSSNSEGSDADDFSELKKITTLLANAFNRRKFYSKPINNNLRISSTSQYANKKQEFVKSNDKKVEKKDDEKKQDMSKVKCYNCKNEGHFTKDCKKVKVKDYEYYKTKMLLAKKDKDEKVLLTEDQAWMESINDSDQEINANMVFMAQIEKVLSDSEDSSSSADDKISEVTYYLSESKSESEYETSENYDNTTTYGLFVNDNDDQEIFHDCENFLENLIESQIDHNESAVDHNDSERVDKVNTFVDYKTELVEESSKKAKAEITQEGSTKRARDEMEQERSKKQKVEDDKESDELKKCLEIIPDDGDDVTINAIPLSSNKMLKIFDREDLKVLWRLVKVRFEKVKLVDHMDSFLLHNFKTMFEHHVEDNAWKNQQGLVKVKNWKLYDSYGVYCVTMQNILYYMLVEKMYRLTNHTLHQMFNDMKLQVKVKNWKLYDSYGVYCVTMQNILYYMLVEKMYLLINHTLHQMFNDVKLQVDYECEMAFELLSLVKKQLKEGYVSK